MQRLGSLPFISGTDMALPFARSKLCLWFPSNARAAAIAYHSDTRSLGLGDERLSLEGDSAARGCISKGRRRLLLGELPLRGAAR